LIQERSRLGLGWGEVRIAGLIALAAFVFGVWLVRSYPLTYWTDGNIRLAHRHELFVFRWLPLVQLIVVGVSKLTHDPVSIRLVFAAVFGLAVGAGFLLAERMFNRSAGVVFAIWFATNPLFMQLATAPYQEMLFLMLLFMGLWFLEPRRASGGPRWVAAAVCMNLACLTRYEAWILVAVVCADEFLRGARSQGLKQALAKGTRCALALGGIPILLWSWFGEMGMEHVSILERHTLPVPSAARDYLRLIRLSLATSVAVLGCATLLWALRFKLQSRVHARIATFVVLVSVMVVFANPYSPGNFRATTVPIAFLLLYGAAGLEGVITRSTSRIGNAGWPSPAVGWLMIFGLAALIAQASARQGARELNRTMLQPKTVIAHLVGEWIADQDADNPRVFVSARDGRRVPLYRLVVNTGLCLERFSIFDDSLGPDQELMSDSVSKREAVFVVDFNRPQERVDALGRSLEHQVRGARAVTQRFSYEQEEASVLFIAQP
jgi:hypothetical protein